MWTTVLNSRPNTVYSFFLQCRLKYQVSTCVNLTTIFRGLEQTLRPTFFLPGRWSGRNPLRSEPLRKNHWFLHTHKSKRCSAPRPLRKKKGWGPCRFFLIFITLVFVIWLHSHKATVSFTLALNLYSPKKRWSKCWIEPNLFPHYYPKATKPTFTWIFERCNEDW